MVQKPAFADIYRTAILQDGDRGAAGARRGHGHRHGAPPGQRLPGARRRGPAPRSGGQRRSGSTNAEELRTQGSLSLQDGDLVETRSRRQRPRPPVAGCNAEPHSHLASRSSTTSRSTAATPVLLSSSRSAAPAGRTRSWEELDASGPCTPGRPPCSGRHVRLPSNDADAVLAPRSNRV